MLENRLTLLYIILLLFMFHLPIFASDEERSTVASWFIHDGPSSRARRDATLGNDKQDATYIIPWSVLNEGDKTEEATSASYRLKDAIGQPIIGKCESANYKAHIGFWSPGIIQIVGVEEKQEALCKKQDYFRTILIHLAGQQRFVIRVRYPCPEETRTRTRSTITLVSRSPASLEGWLKHLI